MKKTGIIILGCLILGSWPAFSGAARIYKYTDQDGKIHYTDSPPESENINPELWFDSDWPDNNNSKSQITLGKTEVYPVIKIIDGDTIDILYHNKKERVRLLRINTPERDEGKYLQAKKALENLVGGRKIRLEFEIPGKIERGVYGRILAYILVGNVNVNVEMVRLGWSQFWTKYGGGKYAEDKYTKDFRCAERDAREAKRGIWSALSKNLGNDNIPKKGNNIWNSLKKGESFRLTKETMLMPDPNPKNPITALHKAKKIPAGSKITILNIAINRNTVWYYVEVINSLKKIPDVGWIISMALLGQ